MLRPMLHTAILAIWLLASSSVVVCADVKTPRGAGSRTSTAEIPVQQQQVPVQVLELPSVSELDLDRYSGAWYEIGSSQLVYTTFQRGLVCVRANYTLRNSDVRVFNSGRKVSPTGRPMFADGRALVKDPRYPGRFSVAFGGMQPGSANYYVIEVNPAAADYEYALVGEPSRLSLWILSRKPILPLPIFDRLLQHAQRVGFDIEAIGFKMSTQDERCQYVTDP